MRNKPRSPPMMRGAHRGSVYNREANIVVDEEFRMPMTKDQILKEWPVNGFKLVKEFDGLPWQHMMWFGRDDDAKE